METKQILIFKAFLVSFDFQDFKSRLIDAKAKYLMTAVFLYELCYLTVSESALSS